MRYEAAVHARVFLHQVAQGDGVKLTRITSYNVCYTKLLRCAKFPNCITRKVWAKATDAMLRELDAITLGDLMKEYTGVDCGLA